MHAKHLILFLVILLTGVGCADQSQAPVVITFHDPVFQAFDRDTRPAKRLTSPHVESWPLEGTVHTALGNPGEKAVTVSLKTASEQREITVPPRKWQAVELKNPGQLTLTFECDQLYLAEPFVIPLQRTTQRNLLVICVDTLRFDFFGSEYMPGTYALFEEGEIFTRIRTPVPWTLPAHVSMFLGSYPAEHGVRLPHNKLGTDGTTLAEAFRDLGYRTVAVTEGGYLAATHGFARGFHTFIENPFTMVHFNLSAISKLSSSIDHLKRALREGGHGPVFAFLHTYEVHCPYLARGGLADREGIGSAPWLLANEFKFSDRETYEKLKALYGNEVRYTDSLLAPLIADLLEAGWIVVLTSDHGEEFGEHGGLLHADTLYDEVLRVPLAVAGHGRKGVREVEGDLVDLPTTLFGILDLPPPAAWRGRNLTGEVNPKPFFSESFYLGTHIPAKDPRLVGVQFGEEKLIEFRNFDKVRAERFDLSEDPAETRDLTANRSQKSDALSLLLENYKKQRGAAPDLLEGMTEEQMETMRALGYLK